MPLIVPRPTLPATLVHLWDTIKQASAHWWGRSHAGEILSTAGFILYTLIVVNIYLLLQPIFRMLQFRTKASASAGREQRRIPRWRRRGRGSLDRPLDGLERPPRRQLSIAHEIGSDPEDGTKKEETVTAAPKLLLPKPRRPVLSSRPSRVSPQSTSLLLTRLPLELRQEIYRFVLKGRHKHFIRLGGDDYTIPSDFVLNDADYRTRDTLTISSPPPRWMWPRSGSLLALPLTCRQVYMECMDLLYQSVIFKVSRLFTLTDLSVALLPQRFAAIRSLEISYEFHCGLPLTRSVMIGEDSDWASCWRLMESRMPGLRDLRMDLFAFDVRALVDADRDELYHPDAKPRLWRWLGTMLQVTGLRRCVVKMHHVKRFNDAFAAEPLMSWYMMVVMDSLERVIAAGLTGRRLSADPPFGTPESEKLGALWRTCHELARQGRLLGGGDSGVEIK